MTTVSGSARRPYVAHESYGLAIGGEERPAQERFEALDPSTGEPSRVRYRIEEDGTKERISVRGGNPIPRAED
jgi:hypothetical protein